MKSAIPSHALFRHRFPRAPHSSRGRQRADSGFFENLPSDDLALSHRTRVEFASLLAREVRMGDLDCAAAHEPGSRFESVIDESFFVLLPDRNDFDQAREWVNRFETGLRAGPVTTETDIRSRFQFNQR